MTRNIRILALAGTLALTACHGSVGDVLGDGATGPGIDPGRPVQPPPTPLTIVTNALPAGRLNQVYGQFLQASGGVTPYRWTLSSGELPAGLILDVQQGYITGTPTVPGSFPFIVNVATPAGNAFKELTLVVQ